ncbi:DUF1570 domain-containing protein [Luteimonas sp. SX5]|uniref:DUF1570 domain-containing protein n=1 Tax=Luteimonas galliterrae TaxID=2940486 RepID=A0ABT0MLF6_9GAMM|nr:DUF1570 domain-containing protein [Luteimonas galliterrae]MCL1635714.1 DUF1570 domain-containing protein [Luteimonas galliterrae]
MTPHSPMQVGAIKTRVLILLIALIVCGVAGTVILSHFMKADRKPAAVTATQPAAPRADLPPGVQSAALTLETTHYVIVSNATPEQTALVARAVESLYDAYTTFFRNEIALAPRPPKLKLMLFKDQAEFKAHNTSQPWAEAFYRVPWSYAYYDAAAKNPYHWMLHEATHQLRNEVAHFPKVKWIDEGIATYFSTSRIRDGKLIPGDVDPDTYPIWHLRGLALTGDLQGDIRKGRIIPLHDLMADTGPPVGQNVNLYYIEYWSLTHFLLHYGDGRYASLFKRLAASGDATRDGLVGIEPMESLQLKWFEYLQQAASKNMEVFRVRARPS